MEAKNQLPLVFVSLQDIRLPPDTHVHVPLKGRGGTVEPTKLFPLGTKMSLNVACAPAEAAE